MSTKKSESEKKSVWDLLGENECNIIAFGRGKVILCHGRDMEEADSGRVDWVKVDKAWTIRTWGTSNGLGELSTNGPTSETVLDAIPIGIAIPMAAIHGIWIVGDDAKKKFVPVCEESDKKLLKGE